MRPFRALAATALLTSGCAFAIFDMVHDEALDGPYRVRAIDTDDTMSIVWEASYGVTVGDGLPDPTVFAFGQDSRYLVAAVHPQFCAPAQANCSKFGSNRAITQYWYVVRTADEVTKLPYDGIKGLFDAARFDAEKRRLGLPEFTRRFPNLE